MCSKAGLSPFLQVLFKFTEISPQGIIFWWSAVTQIIDPDPVLSIIIAYMKLLLFLLDFL